MGLGWEKGRKKGCTSDEIFDISDSDYDMLRVSQQLIILTHHLALRRSLYCVVLSLTVSSILYNLLLFRIIHNKYVVRIVLSASSV